MINTTDRPIILHEGSTLDRDVRTALHWALTSMERRRIGTRGTESIGKSFDRMFGAANLRDKAFDEQFVQALFDYAQTSSRKMGVRQAERLLADYIGRGRVPAPQIEEVKRGLRLALMKLWLMRAVTLPTVFLPGSSLPEELCEHEIIRWLLSIDPQRTESGQHSMGHRLHYCGPRIVFASNWERLEDVNLDDIRSLQLAQLNHKHGLHPYAIAGSQFPFSQLPAALLAAFPDRASFSNADLQTSSAWLVRHRAPTRTYKAAAEREPGIANKRAQPDSGTLLPQPQTLSQDALQAETHEAVVRYVQRLRDRPPSADWRRGTPQYPGREHVRLDEISRRWIESFHAFLHQRKYGKSYRSDANVVAALNLLADYLFLYLPWWKELHPAGVVDIPSTPRRFVKYAFGNRFAEEPLSAFPMTFAAIVRKRRPSPDSAATAIRHAALYFRFVGSYFGDDEDMAGSGFRAPLDEEFDSPRILGKKNKTTKVVIPSNLYGHMLFYFYAVEEFGQHLLDQALSSGIGEGPAEIRNARELDPTKFGHTPLVRYRGQNIPLTTVPNVFSWEQRDILSNGQHARLLVPHLTALRLLIVALETGLRCQSIQWLDITNWDSHNNGVTNQYTYRLYVNTDKTMDEPWVVPVVYRVREVLTREACFKGLFANPMDLEAVPYEGYEVSPFAAVRPLFKSGRVALPIADEHYSRVWVELQIAFEAFYKRTTGETSIRLFNIRAIRRRDGELSMGCGPTGNPFCKLTTLAVHTPHACRATFATNRQGVLEIWDLIDLLGHRNVVSASHYSKYSFDQLSARLAESDKATLGDFFVFEEGDDSAYIRPDKPDSALVRSFSKDRGRTIAAFGFMAG
jgi:hypothetical protein